MADEAVLPDDHDLERVFEDLGLNSEGDALMDDLGVLPLPGEEDLAALDPLATPVGMASPPSMPPPFTPGAGNHQQLALQQQHDAKRGNSAPNNGANPAAVLPSVAVPAPGSAYDLAQSAARASKGGKGKGKGRGKGKAGHRLSSSMTSSSSSSGSSSGGGGGGAGDDSEASPETQPEKPPAPAAGSGNAPTPFIFKTYSIVSDPATDKVIAWVLEDDGTADSFVVKDPVTLARDVLPLHFKHNNFTSFVRQLHTYGFRKIDSERWCFRHPLFKLGQPELLTDIRRRRKNEMGGGGGSDNTGNSGGSSGKGPGAGRSDPIETGSYGGQEQFEQLRRDKDVLVGELVRMRHLQNQIIAELQEQRRRQARTEGRVGALVSNVGQMMTILEQCFQGHPQLPDNLRKRRRTAGGSSLSFREVPRIEWSEHAPGVAMDQTADPSGLLGGPGVEPGVTKSSNITEHHDDDDDDDGDDDDDDHVGMGGDDPFLNGDASGIPDVADFDASIRDTENWTKFLGELSSSELANPLARGSLAGQAMPPSSVTIQDHHDSDKSPSSGAS